MNKLFKEIYYPELVNDVQEIYWEHIDTLGLPLGNINKPLRYISFFEPHPKFKKIQMLREKYKFLSPHLLLFKLPPNFSTEIHLDGIIPGKMREISCNIPIKGCTTDCVTEFYDASVEDFWLDPITNTRWLISGKTPNKISEYSLTTNPILTNPQISHRVNNLLGTGVRISISWTIDPTLSWEYLCKYFDEQVKVL